MPRKKVDSRVRTLIENAVKTHTRSFFVIVGDRGKDQVVNLHYILSKAQVKARPNVLWCYNKDLGFSTHRQKRMKAIKKLQMRGIYDADKENPFDLFVSSVNVRWCYYKETQKILGNTYGMVILQDFEAITPNILCRTMETVEGGGIVVLLLHTMSSLKQLYTLSMDVHSRFRTDAHSDVVGRFNERFILSLASCASCLVLDDELNVLPISKHSKAIMPVIDGAAGAGDDSEVGPIVRRQTDAEKELMDLKTSLAATELIGSLVGETKTLDQAKAVLTFAEAIAEKSLRSTVALTAGRGRGKSAALGLAIAAAIGYGYANIFVTSPSPENLNTLFEFVFKGLEALAYKEHIDYEAVASTNPEFNKAIVRVNVFRGHRQTIQYIEPHDSDKLAQAELVVIDEAAAIPLPLVKQLLGPYLVFLASTINGYEGTGRSLSLKLLQQLRQQQATAGATGAGALPGAAGGVAGRTLREVILSEPIRYAAGDAIEGWLNDLLCLDATTPYRLGGRLPAPSDCQLYAVDRDALFSYHKVSEDFLHRMMSLYVSSHYKNTPNDLQLMSDAPAHKLFVLLGPVDADSPGGLPDVLCVIQVCLEGQISRESLKAALARGARSAGDLIPWTLSQQFQDDGFAQLSGARVVRIATHPDATKLGYGTKAMQLLTEYYQGRLIPLSDDADDLQVDRGLHRIEDAEERKGLDSEKVRPRKELPPLLVSVHDIKSPERLHWLGVSFGLTLPLFGFWKRSGFIPMYLRQTANDLTAEHTMIMMRELDSADMVASPKAGWSSPFAKDFARRYMQLLSFEFRSFDVTTALSVLDAAISIPMASAEDADGKDAEAAAVGPANMTAAEAKFLFTGHDVKRLESYARGLVDYHMILDLLPDLARLYFSGKFHGVGLQRLQAGILLALGLQRVSVEAVSAHFDVAVNQVLALFSKTVRKLFNALNSLLEGEIERALAGSTTAMTKSKPATTSATPVAVAPEGSAVVAVGRSEPVSGKKRKEGGSAKDESIYDPTGRLASGKAKKARSARD